MASLQLQQALLPAEPISLKLRYLRPFERGMAEGALAIALDVTETGEAVAYRCGYIVARERSAFAQGFELGKKYLAGYQDRNARGSKRRSGAWCRCRRK